MNQGQDYPERIEATPAGPADIAATAIIRGWQAPAWLTGLRLPARMVEINGTVHTIAGWPAEPG